MKKFKYFYEAWWFLNEHSKFKNPDLDNGWGNEFQQNLCIDVVKVNPITRHRGRFDFLNVKTEIWLENGEFIYDEFHKKYMGCHDIKLDCGASTFEKAIIKLANLVYKHYGNK